jgi:hypothetical protein
VPRRGKDTQPRLDDHFHCVQRDVAFVHRERGKYLKNEDIGIDTRSDSTLIAEWCKAPYDAEYQIQFEGQYRKAAGVRDANLGKRLRKCIGLPRVMYNCVLRDMGLAKLADVPLHVI